MKGRRPLVVLRPDAGPGCGRGHLARCAVLAGALRARGARTLMLVPTDVDVPRGAGPVVRTRYVRAAGGTTLEELADTPGDAVVVDSYLLRPRVSAAAVTQGPLWLAMDAPAVHAHAFGVFGAIPLGAETAVDVPKARRLLGPRFALVRRPTTGRRGRRSRRDVLLSFGAEDARGLLRPLAAALASDGHDVLGVVSPWSKATVTPAGELRPGHPRIRFVSGRGGVGPLLAAAGCAVVPASQTMLEALAGGVPVVAIATARSQRLALAAYARLGLVVDAGGYGPALPARVRRAVAIAMRPARWARLSLRGCAVVDGQGPERVAAAIWDSL